MRLNDLGQPKMLFFACLALFILLNWLNRPGDEKPVLLTGVVTQVQAQDGVVRAVAVDVNDMRYVVRVPGKFLASHPAPELQENQEAELLVTNFKGEKMGVVCELVDVVKAGPVRGPADGGSAPQGNPALPVDDLKAPLGLKGM